MDDVYAIVKLQQEVLAQTQSYSNSLSIFNSNDQQTPMHKHMTAFLSYEMLGNPELMNAVKDIYLTAAQFGNQAKFINTDEHSVNDDMYKIYKDFLEEKTAHVRIRPVTV